MRNKLKDILFANENTGDFSGAGTFQGGPYGFGNRYQLANSEVWPELVDPEEDLPNNPSMWPAVRAQKDTDKTEYKSLESSEVYDDKVHLLPGEDTVRDELLNEPDLEPSYFYSINERDAVAGTYRDLPGFPAMNSLVDPEEHVPDDEDPDREAPEEERYNVPQLLPGGREAERGKPFGHGHYDQPEELNLSKGSSDTSMYDPMNDEITDNDLKLNQNRNKSLNGWKETDQENKGHTNRDVVFNHLVKPVDYIKKSWGQNDYVKDLDNPDDVPLHAGSMGVIAAPVKHVPGNVAIYKKGNPGYSLGEAKETMAKEQKRELKEYVPEDLDKKTVDDTYGNGIGQIMKAYEFPAEDRKIKKAEKPLEPENKHIPYTYPGSKLETIVLTKVFEELEKLAKSKK